MHRFEIAWRFALFTLTVGSVMPALAQQPPDAGRALQELQPPRLQPPKPAIDLQIDAPRSPPGSPGGMQVSLTRVVFSGNSVIDTETLQAAIGDVSQKTFDLAGLRSLADSVADVYRASGYPFVRAYLPPQPLASGVLQITVVEGRYDKVQAVGDAPMAARAQDFLSALQPGKVIQTGELERTALILDDLPGIKIEPVIYPGEKLGTGNLDVKVERGPLLVGNIGYDDYGNRYAGQHQIHADLQVNSPFLFGDQITARGIYSDEGQWLGSLGYSVPLGTSGLRGNIGFAHTYYQLGKDFSSLNATGTANVRSLGLSYPLLRSRQANVTLSATLQHKKLNDKIGNAGKEDRKSNRSLPVALVFDRQDEGLANGVTYGSVMLTPGQLNLGDSLENVDIASRRNTRGRFTKLNLDIVRLQGTGLNGVSIFGRVSAQTSDSNLDSSEKFSLGGPDGVRAYPVSEGVGDEGWLLQLELRYAVERWEPYAFYDAGHAKRNAKPSDIIPVVVDNQRSIAGGGLGVRYSEGPWNWGLALAWRSRGGTPEADPAPRHPRAWFRVNYFF